MIVDAYITPISPEPHDQLWTAKGGWDDVRDLIEDPQQWVSQLKPRGSANAAAAQVALPPGKPVTFVFVYPLERFVTGGAEQGVQVVIEGSHLSNVVFVRGTPRSMVARPTTAAPAGAAATPTGPASGPRIVTHDLGITLRQSDGVGYAHFPIGPAGAIHDAVMRMAQEPADLIDELNSFQSPQVQLADTKPTTGGPTPAVRFRVEPAISKLRLLYQTSCTDPNQVVCGKVSGTLSATSTSQLLSVDTIASVCYYA